MAERRIIRVEWYRASVSALPADFAAFRRWLDCVSRDLLDEYRHTACIEFDRFDEYGDPQCEIVITYERPETDDERDERRARETFGRADALRRRRYRILETLQAEQPFAQHDPDID